MRKENEDRISIVPPELKGKILSLMPIKDAVRTSVLSSVWESEYRSIPDLNFGIDEFASPATLMSSVDVLLSVRTAPIRRFQICSRQGELVVSQALYRWMKILSMNRIEEVEFHLLCSTPKYRVPSSLFRCASLKKLILTECSVKLPPNFKGFELLTELQLLEFSASVTDLERLIISCPMLKVLGLDGLESINGNLNICAPHLRTFEISNFGQIRKLNLQTPFLAVLAIHLYEELDFLSEMTTEQAESNFMGVFGQCLHSITKVCLDGLATMFLGCWRLPHKIPISFDNLKDLIIELCLDCPVGTTAALYLFQRAPNIEKLKIKSIEGSVSSNSTALRVCSFEDLSFSHIKTLEMYGFHGFNSELAFLKHILLASLSLERVGIIDLQWMRRNKLPSYMKSIQQFQRASTKVEFKFTGRGGSPEEC